MRRFIRPPASKILPRFAALPSGFCGWNRVGDVCFSCHWISSREASTAKKGAMPKKKKNTPAPSSKSPKAASTSPSSLQGKSPNICEETELVKAFLSPTDPSTQRFEVNYANSDRSVCRFCGFCIPQRHLRIGMRVSSHSGDFSFPVYYHRECFSSGMRRLFPDIMKNISMIEGLHALTPDDIGKVVRIVGGPSASVESSELLELRRQGSLYDKAVKHIKKKRLNSNDLAQEIDFTLSLAVNDGKVQPFSSCISDQLPAKDVLIGILADAIVFGVPSLCTMCDGGVFKPTTTGYKCLGHVDEFTKCTEEIAAPKRLRAFSLHKDSRLPKLPAEIEKSPCLKSQRILCPTIVVADSEVKQRSAKRSSSKDTKHDTTPPPKLFESLSFVGKEMSKSVVKLITTNGGTIISPTSSETRYLTRLLAGKTKSPTNAPTILEGWVHHCIKEGTTAISPTSSTLFLPNGMVPSKDILESMQKFKDSKLDSEQESLPSSTNKDEVSKNVAVNKFGFAVDGNVPPPPSGSPNAYFLVHEEYHASMVRADLTYGKNSFYILQVLELHDNASLEYYIFRRWGRVGDDTKCDQMLKKMAGSYAAKCHFQKVYHDKTFNDFGHPFVKKSGKFNVVEVDFSTDNVVKTTSSSSDGDVVAPLFPEATSALLSRMFDTGTIEESMNQMQIDTKKMPLGNLSAATLKHGKQCLTKLEKLIDDHSVQTKDQVAQDRKRKKEKQGNTASPAKKKTTTKKKTESVAAKTDERKFQQQLLALTNQFLTHIPQHIPANTDPASLIINSKEKVASHYATLQDLEDIIVTKQLMTTNVGGGPGDELRGHFNKLCIDLNLLSKTDADFKMVEKYFYDTQGSTHSRYSLRNVWELSRHEEGDRFKPWAANKNRMLLWHGSRFTNWVRILQQGLRIAPPEAPVTGYMFGKGIYFADMMSKSANYCHLYGSTGLMALAEVALDKPHIVSSSDSSLSLATLPRGTRSTFAKGETAPQQKSTWENGIAVPHTPKPATTSGYLLYNEFIVYDVAQVKMRFLLEVS